MTERAQRDSSGTPLALCLDEPGSLPWPGPLGRLVRLGWGLLLVLAARSIWSERAGLVGWSVPTEPLWWLGVLLLLAVFPYVVNIGFGIDGRAWPRRIVIAGMILGAAINLAAFGSLWSPALGWTVILWELYTLIHLGGSFLLAATIATPGCEMRALPHLWTLLTGRRIAQHHCLGHIGSIDRWERERRAARRPRASTPPTDVQRGKPWAKVIPSALLVVAIAGYMLAGAPRGQHGTDPLQRAENFYFALQLEDADRAYAETFDDVVVTRDDRVDAAVMLATISWRFHHDVERAARWLDRAEELAPGDFDVLAERARVVEFAGATEAALDLAEAASAAAKTLQERTRAATAYARVALGALRDKADRRDRSASAEAAARTALRGLSELLEWQRGWLEPSRLALDLALRLDDGPSTLEAWRSYHWILATGTNNPLLAGPADTLAGELPDWQGPRASASSRRAVMDALASSGFYREAASLALDPRRSVGAGPSDDARTSEIIAYALFIARLRHDASEYYRRRAIGDIGHGELERAFRERGRVLWRELPWPQEPPPFGTDALEAELSERFAVEIMWGRRADAMALHYGHRMREDERLIAQYGREATLRLAVLDPMVTNGYTTWFWDGRAATGGWVNDEHTIIQVRAPYAEEPLEAWLQLTHPADRQELDEQIAGKTATDDATARDNPYAYLPGLALRLHRQVFQDIIDELAARGLEGNRLQAAFLVEVDARSRASSILAHEGRHALDRANPIASFLRRDPEREYRAKLSEIAFAPDPRLALIGGILVPDIGSDSSHGRANERIMRGLVSWMEEHEGDIRGLDTTRPLLPQLDLLSDEQLRAAARSMDPWGGG